MFFHNSKKNKKLDSKSAATEQDVFTGVCMITLSNTEKEVVPIMQIILSTKTIIQY